MLRRTAVALVAAIGLALTLSGTASAHPLGNFTTNHHAEVVLSGDRAFVHYVLDLAEIRTFQERDRVDALGRGRYAAELSSTIADGLTVRVDGVRRALAPLRHRLTFPAGAAGLRTTRFEVVLDGGVLTTGEEHTVTIRDEVFAGRLGWREIVVRAERGARLASSTAPARSVSDRLRTYPDDFLSSPLDVRAASARYTPGDDGVAPALGRSVAFPRASEAAVDDGFAALIEDRDLTLGAVLVSLLVAAFWGAAHALTPGHGKALVAGYLVGTRGRPRHAFVLGATVTVTHTAGVFALGLVTLLLSQFLVPEQLYPWLTLVSGLLVVGVGAGVLRSRLRARHHGHAHDGSGDHHVHEHGHHHNHRVHVHGDHHHDDDGLTSRGLLGVGIAAGLLPCPSALVVLLGAIALHRVAFGLALIVAFSVGLAATITAIGLAAVLARRAFSRANFDGPVVRALPAVSAVVILAVGLVITVRAIPGIA